MTNRANPKPRVVLSREVLLLAAYADVDTRTAERALRGETLKVRVQERINRALAEHPELARRVA